MQSIESLIEYFSVSRPLLVIGAGPSCDVGLPSWYELAEKVTEASRTKGGDHAEFADEAFAKKEYAASIGHAIDAVGREEIYGLCKTLLRDTGRFGSQYDLITQLPAVGYLTTNFDSILKRHFKRRGKAIQELSNSKEDLQLVDFDDQATIVKLHGDFDLPEQLVLTAAQYNAVIHQPRLEYLRQFLRSYLQTHRIVFIGYSLNDPDFNFLLESSVAVLRRKTHFFAIVANPTKYDMEVWSRRYNLEVVPYKAKLHDHSALKRILETLVSYFSSPPGEVSQETFVAAQSLYMWQKMQTAEGSTAAADAIKALILGTLASAPTAITANVLRARISAIIERTISSQLEVSIATALSLLQTGGLIRAKVEGETLYSLTERGVSLESKYSRQFQLLNKQFLEQATMDLGLLLAGREESYLASLAERVHTCLMKIFSERGAELVDASFSGSRGPGSSMNLVKTINSFTADLDENSRYTFFSYVMALILKPKQEQAVYIDFLAKAFFAAQAIGIDPDGQRFRNELLKSHTLIVDANILIPFLARHSTSQEFMQECLATLADAGMHLITLPKFCDELTAHFHWAAEHVRKYGPQSVEVLAAAVGDGPEFRRNECIDGFIRAASATGATFEEYLVECCGGDATFPNVRQRLHEMGIEIFALNTLAKQNQELWIVQQEVEEYIALIQVDAEFPKTEARIKSEAEAYTVAYGWGALRPENTGEEIWKCSVLSRGGFLNKVAFNGPYPTASSIAVRPDALHEFVRNFAGAERKTPLSDVMLATYVRSVDHFIDKDKYAAFFSPLVREARNIYAANLAKFQHLVNSAMTEDSLAGYDPLEIPFIVNSLDEQIRTTLTLEVNRLQENVYDLTEAKAKSDEALKLALSFLSPAHRKRLEKEIAKS